MNKIIVEQSVEMLDEQQWGNYCAVVDWMNSNKDNTNLLRRGMERFFVRVNESKDYMTREQKKTVLAMFANLAYC